MTNTSNKINISKLYKTKPLVRCGDTIYYGYCNDRYIIKIRILQVLKQVEDLQFSSEVSVDLLDLGSDCRLPGVSVKSCTKSGLWNAVDVSNAWLERKLLN